MVRHPSEGGGEIERSTRIVAAGAVVLLAGALLARQAQGAGGPPLAASQAGVAIPGGDSRYATIPTGQRTMLLRIAVEGGEIERLRRLRGFLAVPAVAQDGSPGGLSADGETLVLTRPQMRHPPRGTTFAVLDARRLRVEKRITLDGYFSFDALSPDGRTIYLIEYVDPGDLSAYQVRAYDLERERLDPEPIVDPAAAPVTMGGVPVTRAMSPDGRWAYTLYASLDRDRPPFIHALNTETGTAACIDLEGGLVNRPRLGGMKLEPSLDGQMLAVSDRGEAVAIVDAETFEVSEPAEDGGATAAGADRSPPLSWVVLALSGLLAAALVAVRRRRRSRAVDAAEVEPPVKIDGEAGQAEGHPAPEERRDECDPVP